MSNTHTSRFRDEVMVRLQEVREMLTLTGRAIPHAYGSAEAETLAAALGYAWDMNKADRAMRAGAMKRPQKDGREWVLNDDHVADFILDCERRRDWLPGAAQHEHKLTCFERDEHEAVLAATYEAAGFGRAPIDRRDYLTMAPKSLLVEALDAETVEARRWACHCLEARIQVAGIAMDPVAKIMLGQLPEADEDRKAKMAVYLLDWLTRVVLEWPKPAPITLADMFRLLRSPIKPERERGGVLLAMAAGVGLARSGMSEIDIEHGAGKDLAELICAATLGDANAVSRLEAELRNSPSANQTPADSGHFEGIKNEN